MEGEKILKKELHLSCAIDDESDWAKKISDRSYCYFLDSVSLHELLPEH